MMKSRPFPFAGSSASGLLLALCLLLVSMVTPAHAQAQADLKERLNAIEERGERLGEIARTLPEADTDALPIILEEVRELRRSAEAVRAGLVQRRDQLQTDLEGLGAPPEDGTEEAPGLIAERERVGEEFRAYDAAVRQLDLNVAEAERLQVQIGELRRIDFTEALLTRGPVPLLPSVISTGVDTFSTGVETFAADMAEGYDIRRDAGRLTATTLSIGVALLLAIGLWVPVRGRINKSIARRIDSVEPLPSRKVLVAAARVTARLVPSVIGGLLLLEAMKAMGTISAASTNLANAVWFSFVMISFVEGTVNSVFAPKLPQWRVIPLDGHQVFVVRTLLIVVALVLGADAITAQFATLYADEPSVTILRRALTTVLLAGCLLWLSRRALWEIKADAALIRDEDDDLPPDRQLRSVMPRRVRWFCRLLAAGSVAAVLIGYVGLGHYVMTRIFWLAILAAVIWCVRALMREAVRLFDDRFRTDSPDGSEGSQRAIWFWIGVAIDVLALFAFIPPAGLILGAEWSEVRGALVDAVMGFDLGPIRISILQILMAVFFFGLVVWLTRVIQNTAEKRVFPASKMDVGVQNSLKTLIGYVGLIVGFAVGIGTLGFPLANLAIVAGALSVGIGFGLQSIVENFVSGLILLFERPIKVGDWIVTTSGEGIVKRISVRSTEIQTFDRSSIIVPNAELISGAVTNWTHKDKIGRIVVPVGISYSLDPQIAIDALMEVAAESDDLLEDPAPFVYFDSFGDNSQNLELRGYLSDVSQALKVRTRVRVAIWRKFQERGIEIPFPQRDLHLKTPLSFEGKQDPEGPSTPAA